MDKKKVVILTRTFFDFKGEECFMGGGERYLIDLASLLKKLNYEVEVFQASNVEFDKKYNDIKFKGIGGSQFECDTFPSFNKIFHKKFNKFFDYVIYFCFDLLYPMNRPGSIAISHGIWWDNPGLNYAGCSYRNTPEWIERMNHCLSKAGRVISVDTNTINWVRAVFPELCEKFSYIPNYVDLKEFKPVRAIKKKEFEILFPRRLMDERGWSLTVEAAKEIIKKYKDIVFHFVGKGPEERMGFMESWAKENSQIKYSWFSMEEMKKVYRSADLVLIPTVCCEGTSLSCLEAMASGKTIISTYVGGLSDLIINNYNGRLISPTVSSLAEAIEELYSDTKKRKELGKKAREMAKAFSKERWEKQWTEVIKEYLP